MPWRRRSFQPESPSPLCYKQEQKVEENLSGFFRPPPPHPQNLLGLGLECHFCHGVWVWWTLGPRWRSPFRLLTLSPRAPLSPDSECNGKNLIWAPQPTTLLPLYRFFSCFNFFFIFHFFSPSMLHIAKILSGGEKLIEILRRLK